MQESEQGNWHVPTVTGDDLEKPRQWLCATRTRNPSNIGKTQKLSQIISDYSI